MRSESLRHHLPVAAAPVLFTLLWSTGFVGAKYGLPYAEPFTFLAWRMLIVSALLGAAALVSRPQWPRALDGARMALCGVLIHGGYLGGVFAAIAEGVNIAAVAVIVGAQPVVTACIIGAMLGEKVGARQWFGFALGFAGVWLVLAEKMSAEAIIAPGALFAFAALASITLGTVYQKRHCAQMDLRAGLLIQYAAAFVVMFAAAMMTETGKVLWTREFVFAMAWLVIVLSLGSVALLGFLLRKRAMAKTASLFYLVPALAALWGFLFFNENLGASAVAGVAFASAGVFLVNTGQQTK